MSKRKTKLNILDIAIVIAILCSIAAVIFNDYIGDMFISPEVKEVTAVFNVENLNEFNKHYFDEGQKTTVITEGGQRFECVSVSVEDAESGKNVTVTFKAYRKFRRLFSEEGVRIPDNISCALKVEKVEFPAKLLNVNDPSPRAIF